MAKLASKAKSTSKKSDPFWTDDKGNWVVGAKADAGPKDKLKRPLKNLLSGKKPSPDGYMAAVGASKAGTTGKPMPKSKKK